MKIIGMVAVALAVAAMASASYGTVILALDYNDLHGTGQWNPPADPPAGWLPGGMNEWGNSPADKQLGIAWNRTTVTCQNTGSYNVYIDGGTNWLSGRIFSTPYYDTGAGTWPWPVLPFAGYAGTTLSEMYRDGCSFESGNSLTQTISGLDPNTKYDLTVWSWSKSDLTTNWTDVTSGSSTPMGSIVSAVADPASDTDYSLTYRITSDDFGQIAFYVSGPSNLTTVNGFMIQDVEIPEPGTLLLLGTGALSVFGVIRRRMLK